MVNEGRWGFSVGLFEGFDLKRNIFVEILMKL